MDRLSATGRVLLGLLNNAPRTGYDLKATIDRSTRFFWAASYGQIYPELKRLEEAGLVRSSDRSYGERRRTVYEITAEGEAALREWLTADEPPVFEMRDEALLKFFFAGSLPPGDALEVVRAKRRAHEQRLGKLLELEPAVKEVGGFPYRTLRHGIGLQKHVISWCRQQERELAADGERAEVQA